MAYIQFYYPKRLSFYPGDYESPGLGGSEASMVILAKALAARGHRVEVFNACWKPGEYSGVSWRCACDIDNTDTPDVFVAVRTKSAVINRNAKINIFWMLDDRSDGALEFSGKFPDGIVILASDTMLGRLYNSNFQGNVKKIYLPVEVEKYRNASAPSKSNICLHTSMPNRGLVELLKFWPKIREQVPSAELYITSGWELWGYTEEEARDKLNQTIGFDFKKEGIVFTGVLPRTELISLQCSSRLGIFPSFFPEMFRLAAAEMSAAGRPIVVSNLDALSERVIHNKTGFLINDDIRTQRAHEQFVEKVVQLLRNDSLTDQMGIEAKQICTLLEPDCIARQWEQTFIEQN